MVGPEFQLAVVFQLLNSDPKISIFQYFNISILVFQLLNIDPKISIISLWNLLEF